MPALWDDYAPRKYRLYDMLQAAIAAASDLSVTVSGVTIFTSDQIYREFELHYSSFVTVSSAYQFNLNLPGMWSDYIAQTGFQLKRIWDGLALTYNPITNYEMRENGLDGTRKDTITTTKTPTGSTTTTDETNRFGVDAPAGGQTSDKVTTTTSFADRTDTETNTPANTVTGDFGTDTKTGYHEAHEHYFSRVGNIGTQTAADMLLKEYELRKINLLEEYVREFVRRNFYYAGYESYADWSD